MIRRLLVTAVIFSALSCEKKAPVRPASYLYLPARMSQPAEISNAQLQALKYEALANGSSGGFGSVQTKIGPLYENKATVVFKENSVSLQLEIEMSAWVSHRWVESTLEAERILACRQVCAPNIMGLAQMLECDPKCIDVVWNCSNGEVQGEMKGAEAESMLSPEQLAFWRKR